MEFGDTVVGTVRFTTLSGESGFRGAQESIVTVEDALLDFRVAPGFLVLIAQERMVIPAHRVISVVLEKDALLIEDEEEALERAKSQLRGRDKAIREAVLEVFTESPREGFEVHSIVSLLGLTQNSDVSAVNRVLSHWEQAEVLAKVQGSHGYGYRWFLAPGSGGIRQPTPDARLSATKDAVGKGLVKPGPGMAERRREYYWSWTQA